MQLILVRHGEAGPYQPDDAVRKLTAKGMAQAAWTAQQIVDAYKPDLLVASPYVRAQETLAAFQVLLPKVPVQVVDGITPDADPRIGLDQLALLPAQYDARCIVVVCHMNIVAYMAGLLLDDDAEGFSLAEARVFEQEIIVPGLSVENARFVPPSRA